MTELSFNGESGILASEESSSISEMSYWVQPPETNSASLKKPLDFFSLSPVLCCMANCETVLGKGQKKVKISSGLL